MIRLNDIVDRVLAYHPKADVDMIEKAYVFSAKVHEGQVRLSGEPYLSHPMEVAGLLADQLLLYHLIQYISGDPIANFQQIAELLNLGLALISELLPELRRCVKEVHLLAELSDLVDA